MSPEDSKKKVNPPKVALKRSVAAAEAAAAAGGADAPADSESTAEGSVAKRAKLNPADELPVPEGLGWVWVI